MADTNAISSSGTILSVSATLPATEDAAGYEALTFTAVGEVTTIPEIGRNSDLITHTPVADRKTYKLKGNYNDGALGLEMGRATDDAGQAILVTARDSDDPIAFSITYNDDPGGTGSSPTIQYFQGLVMSYTTNTGDGNQVLGATCQVEISGDILEIDKVVGT